MTRVFRIVTGGGIRIIGNIFRLSAERMRCLSSEMGMNNFILNEITSWANKNNGNV